MANENTKFLSGYNGSAFYAQRAEQDNIGRNITNYAYTKYPYAKFGNATTANDGCLAISYNDNGVSANTRSIAVGVFCTAGTNSICIGSNCSAYSNCIVVGTNCSANFGSFALGGASSGSSAFEHSISFGEACSANNYALSQGYICYSNSGSLAQGSACSATKWSMAQGFTCSAYSASLAAGHTCTASNCSVSMGQANSAYDNSYTFGIGLCLSGGGLAIGTCNATTANVALVIGNGSLSTVDKTLKDSFTITKDGVASGKDFQTPNFNLSSIPSIPTTTGNYVLVANNGKLSWSATA